VVGPNLALWRCLSDQIHVRVTRRGRMVPPTESAKIALGGIDRGNPIGSPLLTVFSSSATGLELGVPSVLVCIQIIAKAIGIATALSNRRQSCPPSR
jgi:hypothetical protein